MEGKFTHFDNEGNAVMVDVTDKKETKRVAIATGKVNVSKETLELIKEGKIGKGDVLGVARVAGIMGMKRTSDLIPMCHPIMINGCSINFEIDDENNSIIIEGMAKISEKTGVEMEALTGVTIAALTIYDMCKAVDKRITISDVHLKSKTGGKSGDFFY
ncbi:cyclic pyranopterin monophosphate synthase MoaC [Clostridium thermobutyricum]|uniref:Cyclic pyranopterin monophosphate synthase n=1 Tax=Clostridium thermobutyricum DSM 4928 TaxID=1121339 RepID=A0A1V4SXZ5_9CLOT|nr:cyclic pyranopterin monophosphate synthase MoaC [Clostridium thermobutyricum]OPX49593.1 cyclic pyranopterin monophosphate synthase accessory protein [Clostridium thermobutyricum DSM 4928]